MDQEKKNPPLYGAGRQRELSVDCTARAVDEAVAALLQFLEPYIEAHQRPQFELAVSEVLRNAFEHGNLAISEAEKIRFCEAGTFDAEVERRSKEAVHLGKKIDVRASVDAGIVRFQVTDEGSGFDWRKVPNPVKDAASREQLNGRGLFLIHQFFDAVSYNDAGNSVTVEKQNPPEISGKTNPSNLLANCIVRPAFDR